MGISNQHPSTFNKPAKGKKKKTNVDPHDGLHLTAHSGYCYCYCRKCWERNTLKGICICPQCPCGAFELTLGPANKLGVQ